MSPREPAKDAPSGVEPPPIAASLGGLYNAWVRSDLPETPAETEFVAAVDLLQNGAVEHLPDITVDTRRDRTPSTQEAHPGQSVPAAVETPPAQPPTPTSQPPTTSGGGILRSSAVMASGTIVSRLMGVLRVVLLAHIIGVNSAPASVWDTANNLPNLIYLLLAGGVINAVLVPQITRAMKEADGGKSFTDALLTRAMILLGAITVILMLGSPYLYRIFDSTSDPDRLRLGIAFTLVCLPQLFFYGAYTLLGEVLNARSRFGALMWAPVLANIVSILGLLVLWGMADPGRIQQTDGWSWAEILVLAGSATLGIAAQALILVIPLRRSGYNFSINWRFRGLEARTTTKIAGWALGAVAVQQVGQIITSRVLNSVPPGFGGKAAQSNAFLLFMMPHSVITLSLVTALYTRLSHAAHRGDRPAVADDLTLGLRLSGVSTVAVTIGSFILIGPIAIAMFGTRDNAGAAVADATIAMCLGMIPFTMCVLIQRVCYAFSDATRPFYLQVVCTAIAIPFTLLAAHLPVQAIGAGVAGAQSLSYVIEATVAWFLVRRHLGRVPGNGVLRTYGKLAVAALVATATVGVVYALTVGVFTPSSPLESRGVALLATVIGVPLFCLVYVWMAKRLRVPEIESLLARARAISGRLRRTA
ncbi:murein biosynthesis integral membrane protein MurJ [Branchiibius sp. NY16-3462-2]|uniref:murein biosynthesis integral membrane protein MurJ n=1 Tax=Branchiibius sp. NY16-3462-2 TaxID=1807500 RepID=UPI00079C11DE|nr:murein biosynthesis integral membrane protein MurJ [Branchiibius sp. NY16-3462-2]KYH44180.1 hypothetical protein AZH51_15520 [Branchiibius sp. NY16-3462-2]